MYSGFSSESTYKLKRSRIFQVPLQYNCKSLGTGVTNTKYKYKINCVSASKIIEGAACEFVEMIPSIRSRVQKSKLYSL